MLEAPEEIYAQAPTSRRSRQPAPNPRRDFGPPRDFDQDFAGSLPDTASDDGFDYRRQRNAGYRLRFRGRILELPKTLWGRIFGGIGFLFVAGCLTAGYFGLRSFFLHDSRFVIASSSEIQTTGNTHLTRAQLLSVFGEDVERNIFNIPLAQRRAELESLPWVQHATVMRLLPNHIRIDVTERVPVAFVRQGTQIGMVDANGVLLNIPLDAPGDPHYSFPVVTGIGIADPLSTRAARMKIFTAFTSDLDSSGAHISDKLSEVDLSNPEDVKALVQENQSDILVHFGESDFLSRFEKFEQYLPEWRSQHPNLASVDMRYERQVVLDMKPGTSATSNAPASTTSAPTATAATKPAAKPAAKLIAKPSTPPKPAAKSPAKPAVKPTTQAVTKPPVKPAPKSQAKATSDSDLPEQWHMVVVKPHTKSAASQKPVKPTHPPQAAQQ